ncbi:MAG: hypothetical protein JO294_14900 [Alphaproteobacteria bacterium]|nr:hypothetical protein [Alphaproteobacteria bacterium]MBV9904185.1 hypothetical protein [Alphaproteobacteria bacterium]
MSYTDTDGTIRKRSGWLIPLGVFVVTAGLSALFLLFYLAPSSNNFLEEQVSPTSRSDLVALEVHNLKLWIPANYLQYDSARQGGTRKLVQMFALLPDFAGWSNWEAQTFTGNAADSPVIYMLIREERVNLTEGDRLKRVYLAYVVSPRGIPGPFNLTQYVFRENGNQGYRGEDMFVGETPEGPAIHLCERFSPTVPSPNCLRDMRLAHGVVLTYRFKRAHLSRWREIADGVSKLAAGFKKPPKTQAFATPQPRP